VLRLDQMDFYVSKEGKLNKTTRAFSVMAVAVFALTVSVETALAQALAQSNIKAVYRVSLTDPATGNVYYSDRQGLRSWGSMEGCEREKNGFSGFHTSALEKENIVNSAGTSLEVKLDSIVCVDTSK